MDFSMESSNIKILAISSFGGHWIQLNRLKDLFSRHKTTLVTTNKGVKSNFPIHYINDANKDEKFKLIVCFLRCLFLFLKIRPDLVITTGAAPGLLMVVISKIFGKKSIWIDSIANANELSLSGKLAKRFASYTLSQWQNVAKNEDVLFRGAVIK